MRVGAIVHQGCQRGGQPETGTPRQRIIVSKLNRILMVEAGSMGNQKREAIDLIKRLPEGVDSADIIEELYFKWQVDEGLRDVVEGRTLSHEELKQRLAQWRKSAGH